MRKFFKKKPEPEQEKSLTTEPKFRAAVLYSWNHRPNECSADKDALRKSPCSDLGETLRRYGEAGFEIKSVVKYEEYTSYILQRLE